MLRGQVTCGLLHIKEGDVCALRRRVFQGWVCGMKDTYEELTDVLSQSTFLTSVLLLRAQARLDQDAPKLGGPSVRAVISIRSCHCHPQRGHHTMHVQYSTSNQIEAQPRFTNFAKRNKTGPLLIPHRSDRQRVTCLQGVRPTLGSLLFSKHYR
jgi:hypothetical protein